MVCDLTTLDSMAQRLGRVNRRGGGAAEIDIVYESDPDQKKKDNPLEKARWATLGQINALPACEWIANRHEASPHHIGQLIRGLPEDQRTAAFAPTPLVLPATDILFDAWALTTIRGQLPGRPPVEPYLHGIAEWQPPETQVAWREEVAVISADLRERYEPADLLDDYPLKPHELLRDNSSRVFDRLKRLKAAAETPAWLVADDGTVAVTTLGELKEARKEKLERKTLLLPPAAGGLQNGMLDAEAEYGSNREDYDVADDWFEDKDETIRRRMRIRNDDPRGIPPKGMRLICTIDTTPDRDEYESNEPTGRRYWHWYCKPRTADDDMTKTSTMPIKWDCHTQDVAENTKRIVAALSLPCSFSGHL